MSTAKTTFALYFGNRGFFPASHIAGARAELADTLHALGHKTLMLDVQATRYGAVETVKEGEIYANFLHEHRREFGGVILCLPNFGDETGAVAALKDAGVPIFIHAYPDELDMMSPAMRRDAFCGKFAITDVFYQHQLPFTTLKPHVVSPSSPRFAENIDHFDRVCRVVDAMKEMVVGAIGARVTPFKTVRADELALQRHGITVETFDLSEVIAQTQALSVSDPSVKAKSDMLKAYTNWDGVPTVAIDNMAKLGVVLDSIVEENGLHAVAVRCWLEFQKQLGISPCVLMGEMNERGIAASCETDISSAVAMYALSNASGNSVTCLDWNNNYDDEENKCILFHCGPTPQSMMTGKGNIKDHAILSTSVGPGCSYGANTGRIAPTPATFAGMLTESGKLHFYLGQGRFTDDPITPDFFGCAGVLEVNDLQQVLHTIGRLGHRHHVCLTPGHVLEPVQEAFERYLGYHVTIV